MKKTALLILSLVLSAHLFSQVINIEGKRFLRDTNGFTGKTDLSFSLNQNINQVMILGTNIHAQYKYNKHRILSISDLLFMKADQKDFVNAGYAHLRYNYKIAPPIVTWEAFIQAQYNLILLLDRRYLAGTGPRFRVYKTQQIRLYMAALYMYEYQSQARETIQSYNHRLSNYLTLTLDLNRIDFTSTTFYQPKLDEWSDFRIANDTSLEFELSQRLNIKAGLNLLYDTRQPPGVPPLTYLLKNALSLKF